MDTFELLPSLAQGELSETSAPELVAAVFRSRASGTLWMETEPSSELRCFFRAGDMCGTGPFKGFQTLAHVLLSNDWVNALEIDSSREEAASTGKRHGEVLVAKGLLTHDQLRTALGAQHTSNLTTLLGLTSGRYDWRGWEPPPPWAREVVVDPVSCVVDALEQEKHVARRRKLLDWLGNRPARLSLDWPELLGRVELRPLDRRAAALLALPRSLEEFVQASRLPQTRAEALLVALLLAGGVEPQPVGSAPARAQPEPAQVEPEPEPAPVEAEPLPAHDLPLELEPRHATLPVQDDEDLLAEPDLQPPRTPRRAAPRRAAVDEDEALARLDSLSLDDLAPTPPGPPAEVLEESLEIDRGPRFATGGTTGGHAREEPMFDPSQPAPSEEARSNVDASRDLRKKMLARGMRNLGKAPQQSRPGEAEGAAEKQTPRRPAQALDESALSDDDLRFVDEVRSRAKMAPKQTAYARLGLAPGATTEQIKTAYLTAAKSFHPDRASGPGMAGLQPELQSLFGLLKDAYDAIATPEQRTKYDAALKSGGGVRPASRKDEATLSLKMGEVLLKKRDFEGALNKLRRAVDLDANGDALAALAWALVCDPKASAQAKEEAASLINRALRAHGATARTFYVAGVLWRTKDPDSAVDAFRKALELDPAHSDAALELRLIEQRRGKQNKTGGGVLSGLLFGKRK